MCAYRSHAGRFADDCGSGPRSTQFGEFAGTLHRGFLVGGGKDNERFTELRIEQRFDSLHQDREKPFHIGDTEAIASYDLSKNAVSLGALAPDGPDVELLTNDTLSTPFDRTTGPSTITDFIAATDFVIAYTGEGCGDPRAMTFDSPPDAESTPLLPFEIRSDDFCPDVGGGIVARGDFLGTGSEQVVLFDGETFSLVHTTIKEFQIPEKVVMEKEDDFFGLTLPPTGVVNTIAQGDYNGDGLMDLAIDTSEGVLIAFSDGNGGTLSVSGAVPGLSAIVDTLGPPTYKFGSGTKKSTTTTRSRPQLQ